jgi:hypothetical protein
MKKLLKLSPRNPKIFDVKKDIGWMNITDGIPGRSHNVVAALAATTPALAALSLSTLMILTSLTRLAVLLRMVRDQRVEPRMMSETLS